MGRTYEALERAQKAHDENLPGTLDEPPKADNISGINQIPTILPADGFQELKTRLILSYPDNPIKTIMITSMVQGHETSTITSNFAATLAQDRKLDVLLVNTEAKLQKPDNVFSMVPTAGLPNQPIEKQKSVLQVNKVGPLNFMVIPLRKKDSNGVPLFESEWFASIIHMAREEFDYVILDAPPVIGHAETKMIGEKVDGVILVVECGKTRKQAAIRAKHELETSGSKVLGVILNHRQHYIPEWIYKRL